MLSVYALRDLASEADQIGKDAVSDEEKGLRFPLAFARQHGASDQRRGAPADAWHDDGSGNQDRPPHGA